MRALWGWLARQSRGNPAAAPAASTWLATLLRGANELQTQPGALPRAAAGARPIVLSPFLGAEGLLPTLGTVASRGLTWGADREWGSGSSSIADIKACRDLLELRALVDREAPEWSRQGLSKSLCTAFNQAAKLGTAQGADPTTCHRAFRTLAGAYLPLVEGLPGAADCTIPLHACAKAGYWGGGLAAALLRRLTRDGGALLGTASSQNLSNLWWSLSEALKSAEGRQVLSSIDLPRLLQASAECLLANNDISARHGSNILLACARLQYRNAALMHHLAAHLVDSGDQANCHDLANALYALGELAEDVGHTPRPEDLKGLARAVVQRLSTSDSSADGFIPQALSNMLLGCTKLSDIDSSLMRSQAAGNLIRLLVAAAGRAARHMDPQALANSLYSLALLQPSVSAYGGAVEALAEESKRRCFSGFTAQGLANSTWALARIGYADQGWYAAAAEAAGQPGSMQGAKPQDWSNLWYALALARHQPASGRLLERTAEAAGMLWQGAKAQHCANLLWALANLRLYDERLVDALAGQLGELPGQDPEQLVALTYTDSLWALAVMGPDVLSRHSGLVERLLREAERRWDAGRRKDWSNYTLAQLWQAYVEIEALTGNTTAPSFGSLLDAAQAAAVARATKFAEDRPGSNSMETEVAVTLQQLEAKGQIVSVRRRVVLDRLGRYVEALVELPGERRVAVETVIPDDLLASGPRARELTGGTELRIRQLGREPGVGRVVQVPYWEWEGAKDEAGRRAYLRRLLG